MSRLCFVSRTVRVCVAFLQGFSVAFLLELSELAKPAELPCLCCSTHSSAHALHRAGDGVVSLPHPLKATRALFRALCESVLLPCSESVLLSCSNALSWPSRSRCRVSAVTHNRPAHMGGPLTCRPASAHMGASVRSHGGQRPLTFGPASAHMGASAAVMMRT